MMYPGDALINGMQVIIGPTLVEI